MPKTSRPRFGSLQFWPRKRARKSIPSVNWKPILSKSNLKPQSEGLLGFVGYKVGMSTAVVKDNTEKSMTGGKRRAIPVTILEVPNMKIFSIRFYKDGKVCKDIIVSIDKELKKKVKVPRAVAEFLPPKEFDDIRVILFSIPKQTSVKKTPDMIEVAIHSKDKINFVKELIGKEISMQDILHWDLVDVRGLTKGKGTQGPMKRFGIKRKSHKSEKGRRNPGSIGPWHPARVTFRVPMAGQLGMFTRVHYNQVVVDSGSIREKDINQKGGFRHYGKIKSNYLILAGSVQGPQKRQILVTPALRPNKKQSKKKYEFISLEGAK